MANQLQTAKSNLKRLEKIAPGIDTKLREEVQRKFDYMKPFLGELATYERSTLPNYYQAFADTGANTADNLSPAQRMAIASRKVAQAGQQADVSRGILNRQDQRAEDILNSLLNQFNTEYSVAQSAYNRAWQEKQAADAAAAARAAAATSKNSIADIIKSLTSEDKKKTASTKSGSFAGRTSKRSSPNTGLDTSSLKGLVSSYVPAVKESVNQYGGGLSGFWNSLKTNVDALRKGIFNR